MAGVVRSPAENGMDAMMGTAMDHLAKHVDSGAFASRCNGTEEFAQLCLNLSRVMDYALVNNMVTSRAENLPDLLKRVCRWGNCPSSRASILVLMISVKNACKNGWFLGKEKDEILSLASEVERELSDREDISINPLFGLLYLQRVMSRYYPQYILGNILAAFKVKPGYKASAAYFNINWDVVISVQEQIGFFVVKTGNTETSSCIATPTQASFFLNGEAVPGRTNASMETGPQIPSNVTKLLKYGSNLLQAIGLFNAEYIVAIAFLSPLPSAGIPTLKDYVRPVAAVIDPDLEIVEGPSRVSLNCPISHLRIKTPVKGSCCKHYQCFDYETFVEMNSRRPSWRCPCCNQPVCYTDLCIDQIIAKILKEVADNVVEVMISPNGSWKAIMENESEQSGATRIPRAPVKLADHVSGSTTCTQRGHNLNSAQGSAIGCLVQADQNASFLSSPCGQFVSGMSSYQLEFTGTSSVNFPSLPIPTSRGLFVSAVSSHPSDITGPSSLNFRSLPTPSVGQFTSAITTHHSYIAGPSSLVCYGLDIVGPSSVNFLSEPTPVTCKQVGSAMNFNHLDIAGPSSVTIPPQAPLTEAISSVLNRGSSTVLGTTWPAPVGNDQSFEPSNVQENLPAMSSAAGNRYRRFLSPSAVSASLISEGASSTAQGFSYETPNLGSGLQSGQTFSSPFTNSFPLQDVGPSSVQHHSMRQHWIATNGSYARALSVQQAYNPTPPAYQVPETRAVNQRAVGATLAGCNKPSVPTTGAQPEAQMFGAPGAPQLVPQSTRGVFNYPAERSSSYPSPSRR